MQTWKTSSHGWKISQNVTFLLICSPSVLAGIIFWTSSFAFGCIVKMTILLWRWIPFRFDHDVEKVYNDLCAPFRLERADFARILCCMREIKVLKHGQDYVTEKMTPVDSLSLVLSGRYYEKP